MLGQEFQMSQRAGTQQSRIKTYLKSLAGTVNKRATIRVIAHCFKKQRNMNMSKKVPTLEEVEMANGTLPRRMRRLTLFLAPVKKLYIWWREASAKSRNRKSEETSKTSFAQAIITLIGTRRHVGYGGKSYGYN